MKENRLKCSDTQTLHRCGDGCSDEHKMQGRTDIKQMCGDKSSDDRQSTTGVHGDECM